jgi:uncharacterized protein (TIGR01244 family)
MLKINALVLVLATLLANPIQAEDSNMDSKLLADIGAILVANTVHPVDGITAAGQPNHAAFGVFAASGYTTVVDMRGSNENRGLDEPSVVAALGMDYVPFPITIADDISFDNAAKLEQIIKEADGPVLVHCASSNRVGALLALRSSLAGADDDTAMAHGIEAGLTGLAGAVEEILANK